MINVNWHSSCGEKKKTFSGKVACIRIKRGRGVCGTTVSKGKTTLVEDVHKFEGHIACDSASNSEIVIPIFAKNDKHEDVIVGVLDIDSPVVGGMTNEDKEGTNLKRFIFRNS